MLRQSLSRVGRFIAVLAGLLGGLTQLHGEEAGTFPGQPFNGLQFDYSINGISCQSPPTDTPGFTTSRSLQKCAFSRGSTQLCIEGSAVGASGYSYTLSVGVSAGSADDSLRFPDIEKGLRTQYRVCVPIAADAVSGDIRLDLTGSYNAGSRSVELLASVEGRSSSPGVGPSNSSDPNQFQVEPEIDPDFQDEIILRPPPGVNDGGDTGNSAGGKDTYTYGNQATTNYGTAEVAHGYPVSNCNPANAIAYLEFDLSGLPSNPRQVFLGVSHYPHNEYCYSNCSIEAFFYLVKEPWNEMTLTHNQAPALGEPVYGPIAMSFPNDPGTVEYDITSIYRHWKSGRIQNNGLAFYSPTIGCNNAAVGFMFYTSDSPDSKKRPYLRLLPTVGSGRAAPSPPARPAVPPQITAPPDPTPPPTSRPTPSPPVVTIPPNTVDPNSGQEPGSVVQETLLQLDSKKALSGQTVVVPLWVGRATNLTEADFQISYDSSVLRAGKPVAGAGLPASTLLQSDLDSNGALRVSLQLVDRLTNPGPILQIPFQAIGQSGQASEIRLTVVSADTAAGEELNLRIVNGKLEILGAETMTPGDANGNGTLDAGDALEALKMSVQLIPLNPLCDLDNDGQITSTDARLILQKVVGKVN